MFFKWEVFNQKQNIIFLWNIKLMLLFMFYQEFLGKD